MESEGAVILFQRSFELFKFRYTSLMGDGDAKTHLRVLQADPYDGRDIKRLQCTNHVAKSMGTALRKLVAAHKGTDESISGKGKLTDVRIKELTNYYGKAIKSHAGNLQEMEVAVWATFFSFFLFFFIPSAPMTTHNMTCVQKAVSPGVFTSGPLLRTGNPVTTGAPCLQLLSEP